MSDYERIKEAVSLQEYAEARLTKMGRLYVCPSCGSGTGPSKSPAFSIKGDMFKCFSCGIGGDVFDLAGVLESTDDKARQLASVAAWAGMSLEGEARAKHEKNVMNGERAARNELRANFERTPNERRMNAVPDYSEGIKAERVKLEGWRQNIEHPEAVAYLAQRGLTLEQAKEWGMGYDVSRHRLIIPYRCNDYYHIDRDVTGTRVDDKYHKPLSEDKPDKYGKMRLGVGSEPPIENTAALREKVFFLVEGPMDAVSIWALGYPSVFCGGNDGKNTADAIISSNYEGTVIIAFDNDPADVFEQDGKSKKEKTDAKAQRLLERLHSAGISARLSSILEEIGCNDAGEAYVKCRAALSEALRAEEQAALAEAEEREEQRYNEALRSMRVLDPADVLQRIYLLTDAVEPIPTGFPSFDQIMGGGLMGGYLYILGAVSSLGKTTLTLQIADALAAAGHPVLFVTIEQGASEIVAKSLSRIMRTNKDASGRYHVMSAQDITSKARRDNWSDMQTAGLLRASEAYTRAIAPNMRILEGYEQPKVSDIMAAAKAMQARTGKAPAVFIDYLQLLAAPTDRDTDKQAIDKNVMSLRHLARDLKAPVFAISSLNRGSYAGAIDLDSFKESGAIEYGADVLLGLQPEGIADKLDDVAENKSKKAASKLTEAVKRSSERACELVVLKNRHGQITGTRGGIPLTFYPVTNYFVEKEC